jgi:hypothetical protein
MHGVQKLWLGLKILVGVVLVIVFLGFLMLLTITTGGSQATFLSDARQMMLEAWLRRQESEAFPQLPVQALREPNAGIEALYEFVMKTAASDDVRDVLNTGDERYPATSDTDADGRLEFCDGWGMPYVYIHHQNYDADVLVAPERGESIVVHAQRYEHGAMLNPNTFQIFSLEGGLGFAPIWEKD